MFSIRSIPGSGVVHSLPIDELWEVVLGEFSLAKPIIAINVVLECTRLNLLLMHYFYFWEISEIKKTEVKLH